LRDNSVRVLFLRDFFSDRSGFSGELLVLFSLVRDDAYHETRASFLFLCFTVQKHLDVWSYFLEHFSSTLDGLPLSNKEVLLYWISGEVVFRRLVSFHASFIATLPPGSNAPPHRMRFFVLRILPLFLGGGITFFPRFPSVQPDALGSCRGNEFLSSKGKGCRRKTCRQFSSQLYLSS